MPSALIEIPRSKVRDSHLSQGLIAWQHRDMPIVGGATMPANDGVNAKYLDRIERKNWFSNVQAPYFEQTIELLNAKVKSHYVRFFDATSTNIHLIENASALLRSEQIRPETIERSLAQVESAIAAVSKEIESNANAASKLAEDNGLRADAKFFQEPLRVRAKILSPIGIGYLDLLHKADRLILVLESLRLRGVITRADADRQINYLGHRMKVVPRCAFALAIDLRKLAKGEASNMSSESGKSSHSAFARKARPENKQANRAEQSLQRLAGEDDTADFETDASIAVRPSATAGVN